MKVEAKPAPSAMCPAQANCDRGSDSPRQIPKDASRARNSGRGFAGYRAQGAGGFEYLKAKVPARISPSPCTSPSARERPNYIPRLVFFSIYILPGHIFVSQPDAAR